MELFHWFRMHVEPQQEISMFSHTVPTITIYTIYKYKLINRNLSLPAMMQSLRKIADIRYMQPRQQRVCLHRIYYQFGKYQYLLPLKSIFQLYHIPSVQNPSNKHTQ